MEEIQALSHLIECLYDAAIDPLKWSEALKMSSSFVGGGAASLFYQDAATNEAAVFHSWNENPHYTQLYFEKYASLNPYFPALAFVEVGRVVAGGDLIPHEQFRRTRFYHEWVKPQKFIDVVGANLVRSATSSAFFSVRRHERHGIVDEETRRRCGLIVPHVRRAVSIGKVVEKGRTHERLLENALERVPSAVAVVTETGRIVFANQKAEEYLRAKNVILSQDGVVCAANAAANRMLKDAFAAAERGDTAFDLKGMEVLLSSSGKRKYVAQILSLSSAVRQKSLTAKGVAALFVNEVIPAAVSPLDVVGGRFGLTPSEIRVLAVLLEQGSGVREIAEYLGISVATVKTHLNHIFAKTGTRRQADLVRLVATHEEAV